MGEEIASSDFSAADFARFGERLDAETRLLADWLDRGAFCSSGYSFGFEIEAWLVDHGDFPMPINEAFLARLDDPQVVPELSRFNVEFNSEPLALRGDALLRAEIMLERMFDRCNAVAHGMDANMVLIGTLPTLRDADLSLANMSPLRRYAALNREMLRRRGGGPVRIDIAGRDHLVAEHADIMLEAATTSFQVHLRTPAALAHRYYNASLVASAPLLALAGNSPLLFGHRLWDETRVPLFEQAVSMGAAGTAPRAGFGSGYLRDSVWPLFAENLRDHPILLPLHLDDPPEVFHHLRLHNGTIWRWNRLLLDAGHGAPHLRIEHRILPAGPSIVDMIANAGAYLGVVAALVDEPDETLGVPFASAQENFYCAARDGLDARLAWRDGECAATDVIADELLPRIQTGLTRLGIDDEDVMRLVAVLDARVSSRQTGAHWQRARLAAAGGDLHALMASYCEHQRSRAPVHEWDLY